MGLPRRKFLYLAAGAAALVDISYSAWAQSYPSRPVTMVVTFPAGSGSDILARILGPSLSELLGQQVIIEDVGGGGGITAAYRVARAAPDGYQFILGGTDTFAQSQTLYKNPPYSATTDFAPVALTQNNFPANNLLEFIAYAKTIQDAIRLGRTRFRVLSDMHISEFCDRRHRHGRPLPRRHARVAGFNGRPARLLLSNYSRCNRAYRKSDHEGDCCFVARSISDTTDIGFCS